MRKAVIGRWSLVVQSCHSEERSDEESDFANDQAPTATLFLANDQGPRTNDAFFGRRLTRRLLYDSHQHRALHLGPGAGAGINQVEMSSR